MSDILRVRSVFFFLKSVLGRARIAIHESFVVDLFVTHTCAVGNGYSNAYYRTKQVKVRPRSKLAENYFKTHAFQELVGWLGQATADFTVLGGDFNTDPRDNETSYSDLKSLMVSK